MSNTPKVDAKAFFVWRGSADSQPMHVVWVDDARELERELARALRVVAQVEAWRNAHTSAFRWAAAGEIKIKQEKELNAKANELLEKAFEEWEAGR